jgi:hypothetical protein
VTPPLTRLGGYLRDVEARITWRCAAPSNCSSCWPVATPPRTWSSSCSATNSRAPPPSRTSQAPACRPPCSPRSAAPYPAPAGPASLSARDAALAPPPCRVHVDLPLPRSRATAAQPGAAAADRSVGQREPAPGGPAHSGGSCSGSACGSLRPRSAPRYATGWIRPAAIGHRLAGVPTPAGLRDHCLRLLYRRYHLAQGLRVLFFMELDTRRVHLAGVTAQSQRRLGHPAARTSSCAWRNTDAACGSL